MPFCSASPSGKLYHRRQSAQAGSQEVCQLQPVQRSTRLAGSRKIHTSAAAGQDKVQMLQHAVPVMHDTGYNDHARATVHEGGHTQQQSQPQARMPLLRNPKPYILEPMPCVCSL